jgi:hypothetical protein
MTDEQLERLKQRRRELSARIQRRESALQQQARKDDTRRKVLWGVLLLSLMEKDEVLAQAMRARLDALLYKPDDRALFEFLDGRPAPDPGARGGKDESAVTNSARPAFPSYAAHTFRDPSGDHGHNKA